MILIVSKHWARNRPGDTLDVSAKEGANLLERGLARNASIGEAFVFAVTSAWQATLAVLHSEEAVSQIRAAALRAASFTPVMVVDRAAADEPAVESVIPERATANGTWRRRKIVM